MPELSITLVVWNALPRLRECLASIADDVNAGFAEIIASDNASPDGSVAAVESAFPDATVVRMDENLGFAGGVNRTWPHVRGRYWMLLNPDTVVPPGALRELVDWMDAHPDVGIASPALADHDGGNVRAAAHPLPSAALVITEFLRLHKLLPSRRRAQVLQGAYWPAEHDSVGVGWVPGTAMIIRREGVEQVGLPDEGFFLYGEDIDWCWRMHRAGWRVGYCGGVVVRHAESDTNRREYGADDTLLRIARTELETTRRGRGAVRAWCYGAALIAALGTESVDPRRGDDARRRARALARAWVTALREFS